MRLGIDLAPFAAARTGIPVFARELMPAILDLRPDWRVSGFSLSGWRDAATLLKTRVQPGERRQARLTGLALSLPIVPALRRRLRKWRFETAAIPAIDLFYALNFVPPGRIDRPVVPVVHDLYHLETGAEVHPARRAALAKLCEIVRTAPRVQAVSIFTANTVAARFGIDRALIDIVHPTARPLFFTEPPAGAVESLGLTPGSYWLAVGMSERRKNLPLLIEALAAHPALCSADFPLVLAGLPAWQAEAMGSDLRAMIADGRLRMAGFVDDVSLHALYGHAAALLMPSWHEGFGIPVIEALASGAPVLCADNSALPEASGGHAVLLPAGDPRAWAAAMRRQRDRGRSAKAAEAGRAHARRFNARSSARAAVDSLELALESPRR